MIEGYYNFLFYSIEKSSSFLYYCCVVGAIRIDNNLPI